MRFTPFFAAALVASLSFALPTAHAGTPTPVTDAVGRTVTVSAPADRVVIMFNYEEFAAVTGPDAFDKVVGFSRTVWYDWRRAIWNKWVAKIPRIAEIPDVGYAFDGTFSTEKVIALKPNVVIMPKWAFGALGAQVADLAGAGIPTVVIDYNAMTVPTHVAGTLAIGKVMGRDDRAKELADLYTAKVADVRARIAKAGGAPPKVYIELGMKGPAEYDSSFVEDQWGPLITTAGGANIAIGKITSEGPLSAEYVLASNPEYVFLAGSNWTNAPNAVEMGFGVPPELTEARLAAYRRRPGWSEMAAIKAGHLYAIHHGVARTLFDYTGMQFIAKAMYPKAFADVDPAASLREYFTKYLPVEYEGTWFHEAAK